MSDVPTQAPLLSVAQITELIDAHFPHMTGRGKYMVIEAAGGRQSRTRLRLNERNLRPGGTISGPAMFSLADFGIWVAIIAEIGERGIGAVTTNLNINFLAKPEARDILAHTKLVKLGKRLAVGEIEIYLEGGSDMVAHATSTYSLPPK
jgi:uncharacterized protein (TIGR00369 family)